jgi:hypothetical protein
MWALFCAVWGFSVGAFAQPPDAGKPKESEVKVKQPENNSPNRKTSGIVFPDIEGWKKSGITTYPNPALGYSINYDSYSGKGGRVTVYVYNGGESKIPDDINDRVVKSEFENAKSDIVKLGKQGLYQDLKEIRQQIVSVGNEGIKAHYALFYFDVRGQQVASELYLFSYQDNFIKIRATRPKTSEKNDEFDNLLKEIALIFAN